MSNYGQVLHRVWCSLMTLKSLKKCKIIPTKVIGSQNWKVNAYFHGSWKSKTSFQCAEKYRFASHRKNKSSFMHHAKQKCLFTHQEKSMGDPLYSQSRVMWVMLDLVWLCFMPQTAAEENRNHCDLLKGHYHWLFTTIRNCLITKSVANTRKCVIYQLLHRNTC